MTISTEPSILSYNGDDSTVDFSITWKYFAKAHVVATHRDSSGTETTWVLDTDYTLTAAGDDSGGTLTATTAPATGETLVITLEPPNTQVSNIPLGGSFPATTVEDALDLAAQRDAAVEALVNRMLRVPKTDTASGTDLEIPIDTDRASKFLAFDTSGNPIASTGPTGDSSIPVSSFVETLLDDASAAAFLTTLGIADPVLLSGQSGGQTIQGGTAASEDLVLESTSHATKGNVFVDDVEFALRDDVDNTKILQFQLSGITTATTRTITVPDASGTLALIDAAQSWTAQQTFKGLSDTVYALSGTTPAIDPANGAVQTWTLSGNSTPTDSLTNGQMVELHIDDGTAYTITWTMVDRK